MERLFFWLSGADKVILQRCSKLGSSERIKLCGLGALVLVPATLGMVSMAYAISTIAPSPFAYVPAGIIWAGVILVVDRYLISTTNRSETGATRGSHLALIARCVFAIFVGIAIAHPFVLLWFNSSTEQQIEQNRRDAISERVHQGDADRAVLTGAAPAPQTAQLMRQQQEQVEFQQCLVKLQQYEQSSAPPVQLPCGATTGMPTCGAKCVEITPQIDAAGRNIAQLDRQIATARSAEQKSLDQENQLLGDNYNRQQDDIASINKHVSTDYLARVEALSQVAAQHHEVYVVSVFIMILFVMVDVLPITMKYATPIGEYDDVKETLLLESRADERAKREIAVSGYSAKAMAEADASAARVMAAVGSSRRLSSETVQSYTMSSIEFESWIANLIASLGDNPDPAELARVRADITTMRKLDKKAWDKLFEQVMVHIDNA
jgi:hypothetical protein